MNLQPYQTPPRWWSPQPSQFWIRFWRPWRQRRGFREHGLSDIEVRGAHHIQDAISRDDGVLITPNHPSHADPFVLLAAADELRQPFYFMTAWQVFAQTHHVGRRVLRQHGCFSVNREGNDLRAVRQAVRILENAQAPLVIFPEGEVYHLNDRVTPFRRGAMASACWAARRANRQVSVIPCGLKFQFVSDPLPGLHRAMDRLESGIHCRTTTGAPLQQRVGRFAHTLISRKEEQFLGSAQTGELQPRMETLIHVVLGRLEERFQIDQPASSVPERIKQLRFRVIQQIEAPITSQEAMEQWRQKLEDLFFVSQLYSYPTDYLSENPSLERLAETIEKLEEDVLHVHRAVPAAERRAVVQFDSPVTITPFMARHASPSALSHELEARVQSILAELEYERPRPCPTPTPQSIFETDALPQALASLEPAVA